MVPPSKNDKYQVCGNHLVGKIISVSIFFKRRKNLGWCWIVMAVITLDEVSQHVIKQIIWKPPNLVLMMLIL